MKRLLVALALLVASCGFAPTEQPRLVDEIQTQILFTELTTGLQLTGGFEVSGNTLIAERGRLKRWALEKGIAFMEGNLRAIDFNGLTFCFEGGENYCVVMIDTSGSINTQVSVLIHELTHYDHIVSTTMDSKEAEIVAEVTSLLVMRNLGLDTRRQSLGYIVRHVPESIRVAALIEHDKFIRDSVAKFTKIAKGEK